MCVCVCVCVCVFRLEFGHVHLQLFWILFTEIAVRKFFRDSAWPDRTFSFCLLHVFIHFSASFYTAHRALALARDHAP